MLNELTPQAPDKILMLMEMFRNDPRENKVDLGVGVYKNEAGVTPIMRAIKSAEKQLWESETTKSYTGLSGDPGYAQALRNLVLGADFPQERVAAAATPGGTGAVRQAFELVKMSAPEATVWLSSPSWPNHGTILAHLHMPTRSYRYFDDVTCAVDFAGMMADLAQVKPGDVVLLHGCCHNPTGANLTLEQWKQVTEAVMTRAAIPMIDLAYQGFGDGLDDDAIGVRHVANTCPEVMIAASCSKNFGIYRERAGLVMTIQRDAEATKLAQGTLAHLNRQNFSFPPDHGARLVTMILSDAGLRAEWVDELETMRQGMLAMRVALADELRRLTNSDRFDFLAEHRGMFSRIGVDADQVVAMREEHGVYVVGDSRINVAGINETNMAVVAKAVAAVI
ncbi:MAG: amino acid aminotransferase [Pseudomonadota bacterium]